MDMKTVQQQLKANIAKHQMLMTQLKSNPEDTALQADLQDIQKHIAKLGTIQKNMGKPRKSLTSNADNTNGVEKKVIVKTENSACDVGPQFEAQTKQNHFASLASVVASSSSGSFLSAPASLHPARDIAVSNKASNFILPSNATPAIAVATSFQNSVFTSDALRSVVRKPVSSEPLNLSSSVNGKKNMLSVPMDVIKKNIAKGILSDASPKRVFVQSPMKIRMPITNVNNTPIRILPTTVLKPVTSSALLRFPASQQSSSALEPQEYPQFLLSVTSAPGGQYRPKFLPTSAKNDMQEQVGTLQMFRFVGKNNHNFKSPLQVKKPSRGTIMSSASSGLAAQSQSISIPHNDAARAFKEKQQSLAKSGRSYAAAPEHSSKKISFLGQIDLISLERADKIRNRRYGRRRAVAHPVYSGGLYVSHTATDSSKRVIPPELLDIGLETIPTKRPRGRPRGSTNKRSFSPTQLAGGVDEEYYRILQQAKPSEVPTVQQIKSDDVCEVCNKPGEFLMCDTCSRLYHMDCLSPPLQSVPTGMWYCNVCKREIDEHTSATEWPGLLSVVRSFFAFNSRREMTLTSAREKARALKFRKCKLTEEKKLLAGVLKEKVCNKARLVEVHQHSMNRCENLTLLLEKLRCAINKNLDDT